MLVESVIYFLYTKNNLLLRKNLKNLALNIPNLLSISRIFLVFPLTLFLEINRPFYVFILIIIGGLTDYFDGLIARLIKQLEEELFAEKLTNRAS